MAAKQTGYSEQWGCEEGNTVLVTQVRNHDNYRKALTPYMAVRKFVGRVLGIYDKFLLLDKGKYRVTVSFADVHIGRVRVTKGRG